MTIVEIVADYRRRLLEQDADALERIIGAYQDVWGGISTELDALLQMIAEARERGETVSEAWLKRRDRMTALLEQCQEQLDRFASVVESEVTQTQRGAITAGQDSARAALSGIGIDWNRMNTGAVENIVGALGDGSPLAERLARFAPETAAALRQSILRGISTGKNPREMVRQARKVAAVPLDDALRIARTETMRAYRESSLQSYRDSGVVTGWRWLASLSGARTCVMCLAMHGTLHAVTESFGSHPNCRCVPVPVTDMSTIELESGEDWLKKQSPELQRSILGIAGSDAWRKGGVSLSEFVAYHDDPKWGPTRSVRSIKSILTSV